MRVDTSTIPKHRGVEKVFYKNGNTQNIVKVILETDGQDDPRFCEFAAQFDGRLRKLWSFVKYQIQYKKCPLGEQNIKTPAALWAMGHGDCKSKTLFIAQVLRCLGIPYLIRFTGYYGDDKFTHVYPVAIIDGEELIIDSVYDYYAKEKNYKFKKDYEGYMTKISQISGFSNRSFVPAETAAVELELKQKRSMLSPPPRYDFRGKTAGQANTALLRRQLELLRTFNSEDAERKKYYTKAINMVDKSLANDVHENKISGIVDSNMQGIASILNYYSSQRNAAISPAKAVAAKAAISGNSLVDQQYKPIGMVENSLRDLFSTGSGTYLFGAGTKYQKSLQDVAPAIVAWLISNNGEILRDNAGNPILSASALAPFNFFPTSMFQLQSDSMTGSALLNYMSSTSSPIIAELIDGNFGAGGSPRVTFYGPDRFDFLEEYQKYVEQESGIWDEYLQDTIFKEEDHMGAAVLYNYATGVNVQGNQLTLNDYPQAVSSKYSRQAGYMEAAAFFSGYDQSVINNMGRNTYVAGLGENPEDTLGVLYAERQDAIGEPVTIIVAIITAVAGVISSAIAAIQQGATQGKILKPGNFPQQLTPLSRVSAPEEKDWTGGLFGNANTGPNDGAGNGAGNGAGGFDPMLLLGGGLLAYGGYQLLKK